MDNIKFNKLVILVNALIPPILFFLDLYLGRSGPNPIESFLRTTGVLTLVFLIISLAITPLRKIFGWNGLIKYRRMLGLTAFFYALAHLTTYAIFDKTGELGLIASDVIQRPFIAVGMIAFGLLIPLAVTSTNGMIKRIGGKRWAQLHRLAYVIAILGIIHFWMIVKSDILYPAIFALVLLTLLGYRIFGGRKTRVGTNRASA